MKKFMTVLLVAAGMLVVAPAQAQLKFGVKAGVNISKPSLSGSRLVAEAKNNTGYFFGPMAEFTIPLIGLGVDGALLYSHKGAIDVREENMSSTHTADLNSIEIPINLKYTIGLGSIAGIYFSAGPQFGYNIGKKRFSEYDFKLKGSNLSANIGAGVKLLGHLQAGINYNIALDKTGESFGDQMDAFDFKTNTWQVSVAYLF